MPATTFVSPPPHFAIGNLLAANPPAIAGGDDIRPLVAIEVGHDHLVGPAKVLSQNMHCPLAAPGATVFKPDDAIAFA